MKNSATIFTLLVLLASFDTNAAPAVATDFSPGLNTGYSVDSISCGVDLCGIDWFIFDSDGVTATSFFFNRTTPEPDLGAMLFMGDTVGFEYASITEAFSASVVNSALSFVGFFDDEHNDSLGGPFGDPDFNIVLAAGRYSLLLGTGNAGGSYEFTTNTTNAYATIVPLPGAFSLLVLGLTGLGLTHRIKK